MFELFVASDAARRRIESSLATSSPKAPKQKPERRRPAAVRASSAAVLRSLADRLEPSAS